MAYKDKDLQRKSQAEYYQKNKNRCRLDLIRRRSERKSWFRKLKSDMSCSLCGEFHPACLDFHHSAPENKRGEGVSRMVRQALSEETILTEIAKCDVICSNCHRKVHWDDEDISPS